MQLAVPAVREDFRDLRTPAAALVIATLFTLVALLENSLLPWAPFYFAYAWLSTVLPMGVGGYEFGTFQSITKKQWIAILVIPVSLQLFSLAWSTALYPWLLVRAGVEPAAVAGAHYDLGSALQQMLRVAAASWETGVGRMQFYYLGGILLWAGLGEELFYRGYLYTSLRSRWGMTAGAIVSSAFFGLRHATQLGLLHDDFPWGAALSWVVFSFVAGLALCWLYETSKSLLPAVVAHYLLNLIPGVAMLAGSSP